METALVAARKATPKGDFRIALARLTVSKTAPLGPCRSVLVLGRRAGIIVAESMAVPQEYATIRSLRSNTLEKC
jgi:hypothetical protein